MKNQKIKNFGEESPHHPTARTNQKQILDDRWKREAVIGVGRFRQIRDDNWLESSVYNEIGRDRWLRACHEAKGPILDAYSWGLFLSVTIHISPGNRVPARELFWQFSQWFQRRNPDCMYPPTKFMIGRYLTHSNFSRKVIGGKTYYYNIKLIGG